MLLAAMTPGARSAGPELETLIRHMRQNEMLYRNIEYDYRKEYSWLLPQATKGTVVALWERVHAVFQDGLYYASVQEASRFPDGHTEVRRSLYAFDGSSTRVNAQGLVGNIWEEWRRPSGWLTPTHVGYPEALGYAVSDMLERTEEVRDRYKLPQKCTVLGFDKLQGLRCIKLRVEQFDAGSGRKPALHYVMWIAPERNWMVLRTERWQHFTNADPAPWFIYEASDWRQIAAGIWAPFKGSVIQHSADDLKSGTVSVEMRAVASFGNIELNPHYDIDLFRNIEMPKNGQIWLIKAGKPILLRSPVAQPAQARIQLEPAKKTRSRIFIAVATLLGVAASLVVVVALWAARRRSCR